MKPYKWKQMMSKLTEHSRGGHEDPLFISYYTKM